MTAVRYVKALERNLAELQKCLLIRETLLGIERLRSTSSVFVRVARESLDNDYIAHAIKIFEQSSQAASFWYLYRTDPRLIEKCARETGFSIDSLRTVSEKLKAIRNGTHFHIDSAGVLDPSAIWSGASLTGRELSDALDFAWKALSAIQTARGGEVPSLLDYTADDALAALSRIDGARRES